jgi:hypothetical protein
MRGHGLYLVHHDGAYVWFSLDRKGKSAAQYRRMDRAEAHAFLQPCARDGGYATELLQPWLPSESPTPAILLAALTAVPRLQAKLRANPDARVRVMGTWWLCHSPWFSWLLCTHREGSPPSLFVCDDSRAGSELLSALLADPELELGTPPPPAAAALDDVAARATALFTRHGPAPGRILWHAVSDGERRGWTRNARGHYVEVHVGDAGLALRLVCKTPADKARESIFEALQRGSLTHGSLETPPALATTLAQASEVPSLVSWLARGEVTVTCGKHRKDSWVADTPTTLLDSYHGTSVPVAEGLAPFVEGDGWCEVRFERLVPLTQVARAADAGEDASVRYAIPKAWAYRFSRDKLVEAALLAVLRAATGHEGALERTESEGDARPYEEPKRTVVLNASSGVGVTLVLDPISSGHGVHGEYIRASFHGLPAELRITARGQLDMRSGGHLQLDFEGAPELGPRLKQAFLEALP